MKKQKLLSNFIAFFLALTCVLLLLAWSLTYEEQEDNQYDIVCMGDSIVGNTRDETAVSSILAKRTESTVLNAGFGGTCMSNSSMSVKKTDMQDTLSMNSLGISICNRNFGIQNASIQTLNASNYLYYFWGSLVQISNVNFKEVNILFIEHGINDYLAGTPIDNLDNPYDTYTFGGAIRSSVRMLQKEYPNLRIILVTPTYAVFPGSNGTCENLDFGGGTLPEYVEFEINLAKELGIEIIDDYHNSGINADNYEQYLADGLHLNEEGRSLLGNLWADYLLEESNETND